MPEEKKDPQQKTDVIVELNKELKNAQTKMDGFGKEFDRRLFEISKTDPVCNKIQGRLDSLAEEIKMLSRIIAVAKGRPPTKGEIKTPQPTKQDPENKPK